MVNRNSLYLGKKIDPDDSITPTLNVNKSSLSDTLFIGILTVLIYSIPWLFLTFTEEYYEIAKNSLLMIGVTVLTVIWGFNAIVKKKLVLYKTPIDMAVIVIIISLVFSTIFSISVDTSLWGYHMRMTGGFVSYILLFSVFYLIVNNVKTKQSIFFLLKNVLFSISSIAIFTILKSLGVFQGIFNEISKQNPNMDFLNNGLFSPTGNTNALPLLFILALPLAYFLFIHKKNAKEIDIAIGFVSSIILLGAITISTISYTVVYLRILIWIVVIGFLSFNVIYSSKVNKGSLGKLFISICLISFALFALGITSDSSINSKLSEKLNFQRYYDIPLDTSWDVVSGTYSKYSIKSFFIGTGLDSYAYVFPQSRPISQNFQPNWLENYTRSNTQIESLLVNSGVLGLLGIILLGYVLMKFLIKKIFVRDNWINNRTIFGLGFVIILFFLSYITTFHTITYLFMIWVILGLFFKLYIMLSGDVDGNRFEANFEIINKNNPKKSTNIAPYVFTTLIVLIGSIATIYTLINYEAERNYKIALDLELSSKFDQAYDYLVYSVKSNDQRDYYHREISSIALLKLDDLIKTSKKDEQNLTDEQRSQLTTTQQYLLTLINSEINKAITINTNNYENWQRAALIYKNLTVLADGKQFGGDTLKAIEESINMNPTNPDNYLLLGYIYQFNSDEKLRSIAEEAYLKAYELQPSYDHTIIQLGGYYESIGNYSYALQLYTNSKDNFYFSDPAVVKYLSEKVEEMKVKISELPSNNPPQVQE